jgi:hypothetical protein
MTFDTNKKIFEEKKVIYFLYYILIYRQNSLF